jgi:hypothetical protein
MSLSRAYEAHRLAAVFTGRTPSQNFSLPISGLPNSDRAENRSFSTQSCAKLPFNWERQVRFTALGTDNRRGYLVAIAFALIVRSRGALQLSASLKPLALLAPPMPRRGNRR